MTYNIPKIIHYCWFGDNEKPELIQKCIESWKRYLPDYEIREWNDKDLKECNNQYVKEAYKEKQWAFVSDYFRLHAIYTYGGIYLDTDNEVLKSLDEFLKYDFFAGLEEINGKFRPLGTALLAAKKNNSFIKELLCMYDKLSLYDEKGNIIYYPNTERFKKYLYENYDIPEHLTTETKIILKPNHVIFPSNYFCKCEDNISFVIHHYDGSWVPNAFPQKKRYIFKNIYLRIYMVKKGHFFEERPNIQETIIFAYPRHNKRTVAITIGIDKK